MMPSHVAHADNPNANRLHIEMIAAHRGASSLLFWTCIQSCSSFVLVLVLGLARVSRTRTKDEHEHFAKSLRCHWSLNPYPCIQHRAMKSLGLTALVLLLSTSAFCQSPTPQETLEALRRLLPKSEPWEAWLRKTGELPPNFDALPDYAFLPDPLRLMDGGEVRREDWPQRRQELLTLFQRYVTGTMPPSPGNVRAAHVKSREEPGALIDEVLLEFGPDYRAKLRMELIIPRGRSGPFPVFLTQDNQRGW